MNSRIRSYEAALARCGFDAASLLQLEADQSQATELASGSSSANRATNAGDGAQTGPPAPAASGAQLSGEAAAAAPAAKPSAAQSELPAHRTVGNSTGGQQPPANNNASQMEARGANNANAERDGNAMQQPPEGD